MEKVGLYIVDTLHALTQKGYKVQFIKGSPGTMTLVYTNRYSDEHESDRVGVIGGTALQLEKAVIKSLKDFLGRVE